MIVRGAFNHLLRPGLRKDFRDEYMGFEEEWSGFVRSGTMDRAEIEATTMSGLPRQVVRGEGEAFTIIGSMVKALDLLNFERISAKVVRSLSL